MPISEFGPHDRGVTVKVKEVQNAILVIRKAIKEWASREALLEVLARFGITFPQIGSCPLAELLAL